MRMLRVIFFGIPGLILALVSLAFLASQDRVVTAFTGIAAVVLLVLGFKQKRRSSSHRSPISQLSSHPGGPYYNLLLQIQDWQAKRKYDRMLKCCSKSLSLLPNLVTQQKREFGSFDISSIPAIEVGCRYWAVLGARQQLEAVRTIVSRVPQLRDGWLAVADQGFSDADLANRIREHLGINPGTHQNKLGRLLGVSGRDTSRLVQTMENVGQVRRERVGKTYELYLTRGTRQKGPTTG